MVKSKLLSAIFASLILFTSIGFTIPQANANFEPYQKTFIVTGYYSPLPDQEFYVTGSLASDKRLNGNGTNGADGTPVYNGMIAAPGIYSFGTGINCPGIINGQIHDRGGAIVKAGVRSNAHDRLDFWFGQGEEALTAALIWGKRTLTCTVYPPEYDMGSQFVYRPEGDLSEYTKELLKRKAIPTQYYTPIQNNYQPGIPEIYKQRLTELGYNPDDKAARIAFQLRHGLIESADDKVAGNFGPGTQKTLDLIYQKAAEYAPQEGLEEGNIHAGVRVLQETLMKFGYLAAEPTAIFGPQTKAALIQFQLDKGVIDSAAHPAAGTVGPGTAQAFRNLALAEGKINDEDNNQIAILKAEENERLLLTQAEELAKNIPTDKEAEESTLDPYQAALRILGQEWIRDHSDQEEGSSGGSSEEAAAPLKVVLGEQKGQSVQVALSTFKDDKSFQNVKEKLSPIVNPFGHHLQLGSVHPEVRKIQKLLKENGYFEGEVITDFFGPQTKKAVTRFQVDFQVIESISSPGAGIIGPKTLRSLNALHYQQEFSQPEEVTDHIRAPAVNPDDLEIAMPLQQALKDSSQS
ncbi:MAG: peptidoglycan-binding protein [bacterium]|nr:peptidoglycan-binding protein [bacterium]